MPKRSHTLENDNCQRVYTCKRLARAVEMQVSIDRNTVDLERHFDVIGVQISHSETPLLQKSLKSTAKKYKFVKVTILCHFLII